MNFLMKVFLIALVSVTLLMGGCSQINVSTRVLPSGEIQQVLSVKIDINAVKKAGYDVNEVMDTAKIVINDYMNGRYGDNILVTRIPLQSNNNSGEILTGVAFASASSYNQFYNITEEDLSKPNVIKKGLFYDTEYLSQSKLIFADDALNADDGLYANIEATFKNKYGENNIFVKEKISMSYSYALPIAQARVLRVRSNADTEYDYTGVNGSTTYTLRYFVWEYDQTNKDFEAVLFVRHIHGWAWYMLAFLLTGIFAGIIALIKYYKDRNTKLMEIINRIKSSEVEDNKLDIEASKE